MSQVLPALRLSYKHLPQHLRQCFTYCSIFPKDYRMEKEVLINLWMANGFFQPKGSMELEDIGNGIFNDLLWRSLFQDVEKDIYGNVVACKMHDLVHDLACSITMDECFSVVTVGDEELTVGRSYRTRHLALDSNRLFTPNFGLTISQSCLRTLLHLGKYNHNYDVPPQLDFSNLIHLRVLDLSGTRVKTLPVSIGKLTLLRYLDLSETLIALLPDKVLSNLRSLQTLKLRTCRRLQMLPGNMSKLTNLRHLDITQSDDKLLRMPAEMGQLKCLQMLSHFIVSKDIGYGVGELQELDHLEGTLAIRGLRNVRDPTDAENAKLIRKQNIRYLKLNWYYAGLPVPILQQTNGMHEKLIADALQPHPNLVRLNFHYYCGSDFPSWMNSTCLPSLVEISLVECRRCKHLPTLGLLPHLKVLNLYGMPVECIGNEFYWDESGSTMIKIHDLVLFPALEELRLYEMRNLKEWKGWSSSRIKEGEAKVSIFPVLKMLKIKHCPKLKTFPSLPLSIRQLELFECSEKIFERPLENLPHLSHLSITEFRWWSFDQGMVLLQNLSALQDLVIVGCPMLVSLPEGMQSLTSLKSLTIRTCYGLKSLNKCLKLLTNLHVLKIIECPKLQLLPDDFQNLVSLQDLHLQRFRKLESVPVVPSSTLKIHNIPVLRLLDKFARVDNKPEIASDFGVK